MLRKTALALVVCACAPALGGCHSYRFDLAVDDPDRAQMTNARNARIVKHFTEDKMVWHLLGGLIALGEADMTSVVKPHLAEGRGVANLRVHTVTWLDIWLVSLTAVTVEGDQVATR